MVQFSSAFRQSGIQMVDFVSEVNWFIFVEGVIKSSRYVIHIAQ